MENKILNMKDTLGRVNIKLDIIEAKIKELEDKPVETIQNKTQRKKT